MGEKGGTLLIILAVVILFVVLISGKLLPAIDQKGDEIITEIRGTSTSTIQ
ncbi:MAG TPA: hypothetical protein VEY70_13210 [Metabacillus sp.]|nr:hypothetical protein [Metabacillus sp.]